MSRTNNVIITSIIELVVGNVLFIIAKNNWPMLGSDPMPWQLFLTLNWKKMIVVNILLAPIIFLQTAYLEEKISNEGTKK